MEIALNAPVECTDGACGHAAYVLIDPVADQVTHLVVKEDQVPHTEYIVPVTYMSETIAGSIQLNCKKEELEKMEPFIKKEFIEEKLPKREVWYSGEMYGPGAYFYAPYVIPEKIEFVPVGIPQIPPGELAVRRGTRVEAVDGSIGKVDEFVVNPENGHITHMVLREGHLWGQKDVIVPVSSIKKTNRETVLLNLTKQEVGSLPTFEVRRGWL